MTYTLQQRRILLVITGGIAAYKSLDLIRRLRELGAQVRCVLTEGGSHFVTPLSVAALSAELVYTDLWSLKDETEMGHIRLAREADLIIVAPATADFIAKLAQGRADDLASTLLLAATRPVMLAPAMNPAMWQNAATQANVATLSARGMTILYPATGEMACGEVGEGRMQDVSDLVTAITQHFAKPGPLNGKRALVTAGPTHEPIDAVRYIANRSSGKQGYALAEALRNAGADVCLVSGPTHLPAPQGIKIIQVETAQQMLSACFDHLPADIAICAAAVADWRVEAVTSKIKKNGMPPSLTLVENPDILATLGHAPNRPHLLIGFAAETENMIANATAKIQKKNCDWIVANDVSNGQIFGADETTATLLQRQSPDHITQHLLPRQSKDNLARSIADAVTAHFTPPKG